MAIVPRRFAVWYSPQWSLLLLRRITHSGNKKEIMGGEWIQIAWIGSARLCLDRPAIPVKSGRRPKVCFAAVCERAVASIAAANGSSAAGGDGGAGDRDLQRRRLTVDFPPMGEEPTLVARFENNLSFMETFVDKLGGDRAGEVGEMPEICNNTNPQGGGDYLTLEGLFGFRIKGCKAIGGRDLTVVVNAGVDVSALRDLAGIEDEGSPEGLMVLLNGGIERLSFFDKRGRQGAFLKQFQPGYVLRSVGGSGFLCYEYGKKWIVFLCPREEGQDVQIVLESEEQISYLRADAACKAFGTRPR